MTVNANEIAWGIESFGDDDAPLILLAQPVLELGLIPVRHPRQDRQLR